MNNPSARPGFLNGFPFRLRLWGANRLWHWRLRAARKLLAHGPRTWEALDRLGIPGFGIDLVRVDFPPDLAANPDWGPTCAALATLLGREPIAQLARLENCLMHAKDLRAWPHAPDAAAPSAPWLENEFLTEFDMALLYGMLLEVRPDQYVEIGSGLSTRVAAQAREKGATGMRIISIDPAPRVEVARVCDQVHRRRLEESVEEVLAAVTPRSVLFFDGSHRSFPGSDVTVFFLALLPRLPAGVIVHIHDIYLPDDYPRRLRARLWSEQYLLAAWLLGGSSRISVLLPAAMLAQQSEAREILRRTLSPAAAAAEFPVSSFWFQIAG